MATVRPAALGSWLRTNVVGTGAEVRDFVRPQPVDLVLLSGAAGVATYAAEGAGSSVGVDKLQHGIACFTGTVALGALGMPPSLSAAFTFTTATVLKEFLWDGYLGRGHMDVNDIAANLAGSVAGYAALKAAGKG